jgi:hypothetical protein
MGVRVDWRRIFELGGLNWWIIASGIGTNFMLTVVLFFLLAVLRTAGLGSTVNLLLACGGAFSITFFTAYLCGCMADERYQSYAFYPLAGYLAPVTVGILVSGVPALLLAGFGFLGAWNGALFMQRRAAQRREAIYRSSSQHASPDFYPPGKDPPNADSPDRDPEASRHPKGDVP